MVALVTGFLPPIQETWTESPAVSLSEHGGSEPEDGSSSLADSLSRSCSLLLFLSQIDR